jgi:hypothetical protein
MTIASPETGHPQPDPDEDQFSGAHAIAEALDEAQRQPNDTEAPRPDEFFSRMSTRMIRMAREDSERRSLQPANEAVQLIELMKQRAAFASDHIAYSTSADTELEEQRNLEASLLGATRACLNARDNYDAGFIPVFDSYGLLPEQARDLKSQLNVVFGNLSGDGQTDIRGVSLDFVPRDAQHPDQWIAALSFARPVAETNPIPRTPTEANPVVGDPTETQTALPELNKLAGYWDTVVRSKEDPDQFRFPATRDMPAAAPVPDEARRRLVTVAEKQPEPADNIDLSSLRTKGAKLYGHMVEGRGRLHEDGADPKAYAGFMRLLRLRTAELSVGPEPDFMTSQDAIVGPDRRQSTPAIAVQDALNEASLFISPWKGGQLHDRKVLFTGHPKERGTSLVKSELLDFFQPDLASLKTANTAPHPGDSSPDEIVSASIFQVPQMPGFILKLEQSTFAERVRTTIEKQRPDELRIVLEREQPVAEVPAEIPAQPSPRLRDRVRNAFSRRRHGGKHQT